MCTYATLIRLIKRVLFYIWGSGNCIQYSTSQKLMESFFLNKFKTKSISIDFGKYYKCLPKVEWMRQFNETNEINKCVFPIKHIRFFMFMAYNKLVNVIIMD